MSIYSVDDHALPSGSYRDLATDLRSQLDPESPAYSESQSSGEAEQVEPGNLKHAIQSPSISSERPRSSSGERVGFRAAEAWTRPSPIVTNGKISKFVFDLSECTFTMSLAAKARSEPDAPTEIYLPDFHFPTTRTLVSVSDGNWAIDHDEINGVKLQRLQWWHPEGDHDIKIQGVKRKIGELTETSGDDVSYLEQCQRNGCVIM